MANYNNPPRIPPPQTSPLVPIEQRRVDLTHTQEMAVQNQRVSGRVLVDKAGEVAIDVMFPVWFVERPKFFFGGELAENQSAEARKFPTVSAVVTRWEQEGENENIIYKGATLAIVTTGKTDQKLWVHWHMEAKALRNPVMGAAGTDDTI